jgi:hypothetical protein
MMRGLLVAFAAAIFALGSYSADAGRKSPENTNEGGHYTGGKGSSHKGGHYRNARTHDHYTKHKN